MDFQKIIAGFKIQGEFLGVQELKEGLINDTYRVETTSGKYILQKVNTQIFRNPERFQCQLNDLSALLANQPGNFPVLEFIPGKNGESGIEAHGTFWRLMKFIEGRVQHRVESCDEISSAAAFLAVFHQQLVLLPEMDWEAPIPFFLDAGLRWKQFTKAIENDLAGRKKQCSGLIEQFLNQSLLIQTWVKAQDDLPKQLIHGDLKVSNFIYEETGNRVRALIDWDTVMVGTVLFDLADMARSFCALREESDFGQSFCNDRFEALIKGYFSSNGGRKLTPVELDILPVAIRAVVFVQALRFLADFLNGDIYYKITRELENLTRAQNQWDLFKGIPLSLPLNR
jgi:Ser/Thr protein kinase RdoA (MazF antagonist)